MQNPSSHCCYLGATKINLNHSTVKLNFYYVSETVFGGGDKRKTEKIQSLVNGETQAHSTSNYKQSVMTMRW